MREGMLASCGIKNQEALKVRILPRTNNFYRLSSGLFTLFRFVTSRGVKKTQLATVRDLGFSQR